METMIHLRLKVQLVLFVHYKIQSVNYVQGNKEITWNKYERIVGYMNVKPGGTYSNHWSLKGRFKFVSFQCNIFI
jgi:hypothetical protein